MSEETTQPASVPQDTAEAEEFRTTEMVARYLFDQMPYRESPPDKIIVERATAQVYAVRIYERDELAESFFLKISEDAPI